MNEQRERIERKLKAKQLAEEPDTPAPNGKQEDDVMTMDGASMYSRVGYNLRKGKNSTAKGKAKAFPHRKSSILDDFEAIANESQEEILNRGSNAKLVESVDLSKRKRNVEL